jgi:hypothetical protein
MKSFVTVSVFLAGLVVASTARAELVHVEMKTLGMD